MPTSAVLLIVVIVLSIAQTALTVVMLRRRPRQRPARRAVGVAPIHVVDISRRRTHVDWAAQDETVQIPRVQDKPIQDKPRRRRRRPPRQPVPGLDAEVIEIGRRISAKIR
jgi:hypothetical protein